MAGMACSEFRAGEADRVKMADRAGSAFTFY